MGTPEPTIDSNHVLHLHHSDHVNFQLCTKLLDGDNYSHWRRSVEVSLAARNKFDFVNGKTRKPAVTSPLFSQWERCNNVIISWLLHSVTPEISESIIYCTTAQEIWEELKQRYGTVSGAKIYQLHKDIGLLSQGNLSVAAYFSKLKSLWDEYTAAINIPTCTCAAGAAITTLLHNQRLLQFLMGLNDVYQTIRGNILMMSPLPAVSHAYNLVLQEEKQRSLTSVAPLSFESSAMYSHNKHSENKPKNAYNPYGNSNSTNGKGGGPGYSNTRRNNFFCENCLIHGHTMDRCFKLHPELKNARNKKVAAYSEYSSKIGDGHSNNSSPAPSSITPEQFNQLMALLSKHNLEPTTSAPSTFNVDHSAMLAGPFNEEASGSW